MGQRRISHGRSGDTGAAVFGCGGMTVPKNHFIFKHLIPWLAYASTGVLFFFSIAHHTLNFWERPGWQMLLLILLGSPLFVFAIKLMANKMRPHVSAISKSRLILFGLLVLAVSSFISWRIHRLPEAFQTVRVTSLNGEVRLLEVKGNYEVIPLYKAAGESNWQESEEKSYQATPDSSPLILHFKAPPYKPVTVLFLTSPQGGAAQVKLNHQRVQAAELYSQQSGQHRVRMVSDFRGIPGGLFAGMLILADMLTFGLLAFGLLVLQEIGQKNPIKAQEKRNWMRTDILILLAVGIALHTINMLGTPLTLNADSPAYLQGAVHLATYGNLQGVSSNYGVGTTILFAPAFWLFGSNPWGIKILLHLIAIACIPLWYRLGWKVSYRRSVALFSGLIIANSPDVFVYANTPMTEIPVFFLVLLFFNLLISALEKMSLPWMVGLLLSASFATLMRSENQLLIAIGAFALIAQAFLLWRSKNLQHASRIIFHIGFAILLAVMPILWWSYHNLKHHGFFGMSDYMGMVLHDGWIYYGDAAWGNFSDPNSPDIQEIRSMAAEYPPVITDKKGVATSRELFDSFMLAGYESNQAIEIMKNATLDSIFRDPEKSIELLLFKYYKGLQPALPNLHTYPLPGEPYWEEGNEFFDLDILVIPSLIQIQRTANEVAFAWYGLLFPIWVLICIAALIFSTVRQPMIIWSMLILTLAYKIFAPLTISVSFWRYTLSGLLPLQVIAFAWLLVIFSALFSMFNVKGLLSQHKVTYKKDN
jgi:4-amino-4-deoxy-L-arabinose transferase-like glycosyltransferase